MLKLVRSETPSEQPKPLSEFNQALDHLFDHVSQSEIFNYCLEEYRTHLPEFPQDAKNGPLCQQILNSLLALESPHLPAQNMDLLTTVCDQLKELLFTPSFQLPEEISNQYNQLLWIYYVLNRSRAEIRKIDLIK
jgi:hypothetical protein